MTTTLRPELLAILVCPQDHQPLLWVADEDTFYNPRLKLRYRLDDGIPVLLADKAETVADDEHQRLLQRAADDILSYTNNASAEAAAKEPS